jgi:hypothetical protein
MKAFGAIDLKIADRGEQFAVPVDQTFVAINQPLVIKPYEHRAHCVAQALVEGKTLAPPIRRCAKPPQLLDDGAARLGLPLPNPFDELVATQACPVGPLVAQLAFDDHLGGDAGMIGSGLP